MTIRVLVLALIASFAIACGGGAPEAKAPEAPATPEAKAPETPAASETPAAEEKKEEAPAEEKKEEAK